MSFVLTSFRALLIALLLMSLAACNEESLYSDLSEQEANEMIAELMMAGMSASKQKGKGNRYGVAVSADVFSSAVQLLQNRGLPRQRYDSLGEVFAKEGFVSSPLEERARLNHALSQEIASTLSSIDGVVLARVHLAVPPKNDLTDTIAPASASVFVKHRSGVDITGSVSQIKALVVNGIENLPYENVTVALFESANHNALQDSQAGNVPSRSALDTHQLSMLPMDANAAWAGILALFGMLAVVLLTFWKIWQTGKIESTVSTAEHDAS